ncbi:hypothetical protein E4656_04105 [Natronospirillum operosum]|uniref:Tetratricopeptide repeat protein n=1 Tax=Natronospirillum operosum TaxID=2759953 RepID=A0A4Z0WCN5_9GAMM|nr:hypothetical protein [Natronospirillum operosum]TGG95604.1 hypothetical protein E4656_04105 [Natronospirillum operosum]
MNVIEESIRLHDLAWRDHSRFAEHLEQAAKLLRAEYEDGERDSLLINNYAAVLLDLHRDAEALALLQSSVPDCAEHCLNTAIAIAKSAYDLARIRQWNLATADYPRRQGALVAYMDWQGL